MTGRITERRLSQGGLTDATFCCEFGSFEEEADYGQVWASCGQVSEKRYAS